MKSLERLTGYSEDAVWRPANRAWEALRDAADALKAADAILASDGGGVTSRPSGLPEGWVAVPIEPTAPMIDALEFAIYRHADCSARDSERAAPHAYRAMLDTRPPLPEPTQDGSPQQPSASDDGRELLAELVAAREDRIQNHGGAVIDADRLSRAHAKAKEWLEGDKL